MRLAGLGCTFIALCGCSLDWDYPSGPAAGGGGGGGAGGSAMRDPTIEIVAPEPAAVLSHSDTVALACVVTNFDGFPDQAVWSTSASDSETLGSTCELMTHLPVGDPLVVIVRLLGPGATEIASDAVQVTVTP